MFSLQKKGLTSPMGFVVSFFQREQEHVPYNKLKGEVKREQHYN